MRKGFWTCQRQSNGVKCGTVNPNRYQICRACDKRRPARRKPGHMKALELSYDHYVALNGGPTCGICGATGKTRKLHRDHEHKGDGMPRGLLCFGCNSLLPNRVTPEWLDAAAAYLRRANERHHRD